MIGQISASLAAMHRTVEDYDSMAKREIIKAKQEKALMCVHLSRALRCKLTACCRRVQKFRADYSDLRAQFERFKAEVSSHPQRGVRVSCMTLFMIA